MAASSSKVVVKMKLLINSRTKKVLFAEANKDCVDFLFHILSLPIATMIKLLQEQEMVGSLGNLYESMNNETEAKDKPNLSLLATESIEKLLYRCTNNMCRSYNYSDNNTAVCTGCRFYMTTQPMTYVAPQYRNGGQNLIVYKCGYCGSLNDVYSDDDGLVICKGCRQAMNTTMKYVVASPNSLQKGSTTYMVMDDLVVKPMSTVSTLTFLNKFDVKEAAGVLIEKEVKIGMDEAVKLLKTSIHSKNVLTDVFLGNNGIK